MTPLVSLLADLVAIPSINPMGRSRSGSEYSEAAVADFVATYLKRHGIDAEVRECAPGHPNVIAYIDVHAKETLLLEAHMDTVGAETADAFTPQIREGRLFGRGACDTKGSLAAFLSAVCSLVSSGGKPRWNILFLAVADEEYTFSGARHAVSSGIKADFGVVGEPTQLDIVRAHKGVTRWYITARGVSAHAAYPERGENAIYTMGHILTRLEDYALELRAERPHPLLGAPSLSVGMIEGGQAVNVVPDRCSIEVDRRTLPGESTERILSSVRRCLQEVPDWEFKEPHLAVEGMEVPPTSTVLRELSEAVTSVCGRAKLEAAQYATDAGLYNAAGIPTVVFGPGDIAQAHTREEWISLASLESACTIIKKFLTRV